MTIPALQTRRWTRAEYERMAETGVLRPDERVELLDGEILLVMTPQNSPHAAVIGKTEDVLRQTFGRGIWVRTQMPLILDPDSEPEPDLAVVPGSPSDYVQEHPRTALLVVEVADTTLEKDRGRKAATYARAGIPEYWIVNLVDHCLEVYRDPIASPGQPARDLERQ
jgi:Uma2 family endonuclease